MKIETRLGVPIIGWCHIVVLTLSLFILCDMQIILKEWTNVNFMPSIKHIYILIWYYVYYYDEGMTKYTFLLWYRNVISLSYRYTRLTWCMPNKIQIWNKTRDCDLIQIRLLCSKKLCSLLADQERNCLLIGQ